MYNFNDYVEQRMANEGIRDWPGQAWNFVKTGGGLFRGNKAQQKDVGDGVMGNQHPQLTVVDQGYNDFKARTSNANAAGRKAAATQRTGHYGDGSLYQALQIFNKIQGEQYYSPSLIVKIASSEPANNFWNANYRKWMENPDEMAKTPDSTVRWMMKAFSLMKLPDPTDMKGAADAKNQADITRQWQAKADATPMPQNDPMASEDPSLAKSGRELYIIKATRNGVPDQEIMQNLMQKYGVKSVGSAKTMIARIRMANSKAK